MVGVVGVCEVYIVEGAGWFTPNKDVWEGGGGGGQPFWRLQ